MEQLLEGEIEQQMKDALHTLQVLGFTDIFLVARAIDHSIHFLENIEDGLVVEVALNYLNKREKSEILPIPSIH
jgi:hypothetical protein